jgi:hypothetical protein
LPKQSISAYSNSALRRFAFNIYTKQIRFSVEYNELSHSQVVVKLCEEIQFVTQTVLCVESFSGLCQLRQAAGMAFSFLCRKTQFYAPQGTPILYVPVSIPKRHYRKQTTTNNDATVNLMIVEKSWAQQRHGNKYYH